MIFRRQAGRAVHPGVLFLFPVVPFRLLSLEDVRRGIERPERYLFYGFDYFTNQGCAVHHNIYLASWFVRLLGRVYRRLVKRCGGYPGDIEWIFPVLGRLYCCDAMVVFSDRAVFPLLYLRALCLIPRCPVLYITVGLQEKMVSFLNARLLKRSKLEMKRLGRIVSVSVPEAEILAVRHGLGDAIIFLPAGVDVHYFKPLDIDPSVDVLSVGADPHRDFSTLFAAAQLLPDRNFLVVASRTHADTFTNVPANVRVRVDVPMSELKEILASCRIVALPVRDNTYSGGTTVMLQAMAMGKPVVANRVGANVAGYGFVSGVNCLFVAPGDAEKLATILSETLRDPERLREIGNVARLHVERELSLERFHGRLYSMVMDMIGHAGRIA